MKKNLIVDGLNIAFRSHYVYDVKQGLSTSDGVPTGIVYGFAKKVLKWRREYPEHKIIVAWDCPTAKHERRKIYADYKSGRDKNFEVVERPPTLSEKSGESSNLDDEDGEGLDVNERAEDRENQEESENNEPIDIFTLQLEFLQNFLKSLGVDQIEGRGYEADDLIATLVRGPMKEDRNIILTSDRDMLQLVTWKTVLVTPKGKSYDPDKVKEEYGVAPQNLLCFRVFDGDTSDSLPGLPRFRKKVIASLVNEHDGSIESIYNSSIENLTDKESEKLANFEEQAHINFQVMSLQDAEEYTILEGQWSDDEVKGMCDLLELKSLRSELLQSNNPNQGFLRYTDESLLHTTD